MGLKWWLVVCNLMLGLQLDVMIYDNKLLAVILGFIK